MLEFTYVIKRIKKQPLLFIRSIFLLAFIMLFLSIFLTNLYLPSINQRKTINNGNFKQIEFYPLKKQGSIIYTDASSYSGRIPLNSGIRYYKNNIDIQLYITENKNDLVNSYFCKSNIIEESNTNSPVLAYLSYNCIRKLNLKIGDSFTIEFNTSKEPYHSYVDVKLAGVLRPKYGDSMEHNQGTCFVIGDKSFIESLSSNSVKMQYVVFSSQASAEQDWTTVKTKDELISGSYINSDNTSSKIIFYTISLICLILLFFVIFRETKHISQLLKGDINILYTLGLTNDKCNFISFIATSIVIFIASLISLLLLGILTNFLLKMYLDIFIVIIMIITVAICIGILFTIYKMKLYKRK